MKPFYLYKIANTVNEKVYIGITSRIKSRWKEHFAKNSKCSKLRNAINKHGRDSFYMEVLCCGLEDYIIDLESKAIDLYDSIKNGYNLMNGHPNKNGTQHAKESLLKISNSLKEYYSENESKNKGAIRMDLRDLNSYYVTGFWFPDKRAAMKTLNMNEKSFYKWRNENTLGDVCHPQSKSISHSPVYVSGFWFDSLIDASVVLSITMERLQLFLRKGDVEAELKSVGSKPRKKPVASAFGVNQRENGKFRTVLTYNKKKVLDKTFETEQEATTAFDNCYEEIYGDRPNKTIREDSQNNTEAT